MFEDEEFDWDLEEDNLLSNARNSVSKTIDSRQTVFSTDQLKAVGPPASTEEEAGSSSEDEVLLSTLYEQSKNRDRIPDKENNLSHSKRSRLVHEPVFKLPRLDPPPVPQPPHPGGSSGRLRPRFPGPAGVIHRGRAGIFVPENSGRRNDESGPNRVPSSQTQEQQHQTVVDLTEGNLAWQLMLRSEEVANEDASASLLDVYNIAWAKEKMIQTGLTFKIPMLIGAIKSLDLSTALDPRCELIDCTGSMYCLMHRDMYDRHSASLALPGTVIFLKNVTVVKQSNGTLSGIITPNNLVSIYSTKDSIVSTESLARLTKNDVRRNAAKINRDEKAQLRVLGSSSSIPSIVMSNASHSTPPVHQPTAQMMPTQFMPEVTSTPMMVSNILNVSKRPNVSLPIGNRANPPLLQNVAPPTRPLSTSLGLSPLNSASSLVRATGPALLSSISSMPGSTSNFLRSTSSIVGCNSNPAGSTSNLPGSHVNLPISNSNLSGSTSNFPVPSLKDTSSSASSSASKSTSSSPATNNGSPPSMVNNRTVLSSNSTKVPSPIATSIKAQVPSCPGPRSSTSLLQQFKAPADSPPSSRSTILSQNETNEKKKNSSNADITSNIIINDGSSGNVNISKPAPVKPRFNFKPKFQVPVKSSTQNMNDSLFYNSQTATQGTPLCQDRSSGLENQAGEDLDNLFDGLDEDSIFGDFEDAD